MRARVDFAPNAALQRLFAFTLLGLWLCAGCNEQSGAPLHFVLPDGFTGTIQIVEEAGGGLAVREEAGRFTYVIPRDGQLHVQSLAPFYRWHKESAAYQSGGAILTDTDDNVPDDTLALRSLGTLMSNDVAIVRYFVGTKTEEEAFR